MTKDGFEPSNIQIRKDETVIFQNKDSRDRWPASNNHPTHDIYKGFDPQKPIKPGESWEFKFEKEGEWQFHDHLYPQIKGTVSVGQKLAQEQAKNNNFLAGLSENFQKLKNSLAKTISSLIPFKKNSQNQAKAKFKNISEIKNASSSEVYKNLNFDCKPEDYDCISSSLKKITSEFGPQTATEVLDKLNENKRFSKSIDDHQFSHEIGRQTADTFGYNGQSFLLCPMSSYNGGCQHGFFEGALSKSQNSKDAINLVCGSLDNSYSSKFIFYCYHGVGHGVMMAQAYDLKKSLEICDSIGINGSEGCWQGVFMENVNSALKNQAKEGIFSKEEPLSPCNNTETKYRYQCYINHSGYLMLFFGNQIEKAAAACLKADDLQAPCLQSLGLLTTNPSWQMPIIHNQDSENAVSVALEICSKFPSKTRSHCFIGALDNILNNDAMNLEKRAIKFCQQSLWDKKDCYYQIGINVARQVVSLEERRSLCQKTDSKFLESCFRGAGI